MKEIKISEMHGFRVGNAQNFDAATGCTAIICEKGAFAGVDVRGGSPASRETELLKPVNTVQQIHAVMLSGGSAFGLEAGDGAMQFLEEKEIGFDTGFGRVPIVCGASLSWSTVRSAPTRQWATPHARPHTQGKSRRKATTVPVPVQQSVSSTVLRI